MKGIPIRATFTDILNDHSNKSICIEAIADLGDCSYVFIVHSFKDAENGELLPMEEITMRYIAENTIPCWIDDKHKSPTALTRELGKAIEATEAGKEYIAMCFLRTLN